MLKIIQIVTLLQGGFLGLVLLLNRKKYRKPTFWLLLGSIASIILYILGDDENGFFPRHMDLFFFDASLFITFLFLFIIYFVSEKRVFRFRHLMFFLPNIAYFAVELYESRTNAPIPRYVEMVEILIQLVFLLYIGWSVGLLLFHATRKWMLYFLVPLAVITGLSTLNEVFEIMGFIQFEFLADPAINTYLLVLVAFLFYFISFKLILSPSQIIHFQEKKKYMSSGLNQNLIEDNTQKLIDFMEKENAYLDSKLSLPLLAQRLNIPKQYISEILNVHLHTNFQDFVNGYRVEAFIEKLKTPESDQLTFVAMASEVGFRSKSGFYSAFKKLKGVTPSEYKEHLSHR